MIDRMTRRQLFVTVAAVLATKRVPSRSRQLPGHLDIRGVKNFLPLGAGRNPLFGIPYYQVAGNAESFMGISRAKYPGTPPTRVPIQPVAGGYFATGSPVTPVADGHYGKWAT